MRYVAVIALVDFALLVLAGLLLPGGGSLLAAGLFAAFVCAVGIPIAVFIGFPMLWVSRKIAAGSPVPLVLLGTIAGAVCAVLASWFVPLQSQMIAIGAVLGAVSALLWWAFVERMPNRRAHYD